MPALPWPGGPYDPRVPSAPAALADTVLDMVAVSDVPLDTAGPQPAQLASELTQTAPEGMSAIPDIPPSAGRVPAVATPRDRGDDPAGGRPLALAGVRLAAAWRLTVPPRFAVPRASAAQWTAWRSAASGGMPWVVMATVVPLCLLQVPFGEFTQFTNAAATTTTGSAAVLLRSGSLALPFLAAAAPLSALAVRRLGAWSVLLAGLIVIVAGDGVAGLSGHAATSAALTGTVSAIRGAGAGLAFPATAALAAGRTTTWARTGRRGWLLAAWWAAVTVAALAVAPGLSRPGPAAGGWMTAFGPFPWLVAVALAAVVLDPLLAGRPWPLTWRADHIGDREGDPIADRVPFPAFFSATERARLTLLVPSAAALAVIAVAVSYQPRDTIVTAALCEVAGLFAMAALVYRGAPDDGFPIASAVAGFVIAPASAALLSLRTMAGGTAGSGAMEAMLAVAAVVGAVLGAGTAAPGLRWRARDSRGRGAGSHIATAQPCETSLSGLRPVIGLLFAGAALIVAFLAGPFANPVLLGVLIAAMTGGLTVALARPAREVTTAGAMAGVVLLACGMLAGYLAAAAIGTQLSPAGQHPVPHGLVTAFGWWALTAAGAAVTVAVVQWARRGHHEPWLRELRRHEPPRHEAHRHDPFRHDLFRYETRSCESGLKRAASEPESPELESPEPASPEPAAREQARRAVPAERVRG
jgi:hypothetical protein